MREREKRWLEGKGLDMFPSGDVNFESCVGHELSLFDGSNLPTCKY